MMKKNMFAGRISDMPTSIFSTMSRLAFEHRAVNLGQGFPDFDGPEWIMEEAFKAMKMGKNQYAPSNGIYSLRKNVTDAYKGFYDLNWDPEDEITVTAGATEALFSTIMAFVEEGDEVIMFEPFYDAHQADVILAGGRPVYVTLNKPDDTNNEFHFDFDDMAVKVSDKTKAIILNNPNNPTGKVFSNEELQFITKLAIDNDLLVISDEVYEFLTFDGIKHTPIASLPGMKDRTITISSTGKTFGMTGWKIGYAIACEKLTEAIRKVHQWATFAVNTPGQHAMAFAFTQLPEYLPLFRKDYQQKRDLVITKLSGSRFNVHVPKGSYFLMVDIPGDANVNDIDCAFDLVKDHGVATIPPSVFYGESEEGKTMLRICFAKNDNTLIEGITRLCKY